MQRGAAHRWAITTTLDASKRVPFYVSGIPCVPLPSAEPATRAPASSIGSNHLGCGLAESFKEAEAFWPSPDKPVQTMDHRSATAGRQTRCYTDPSNTP